jgi:thiosulfate dehydrogenase
LRIASYQKAAMIALAGCLAGGAIFILHRGANASPNTDTNTPTSEAWVVPNADSLLNDNWGRTVRYGRDLIAKTASLIGPEVSNVHQRYAGNNLSCQNCHLQAGVKQYGLSLVGVYADFPNYRARSGATGTIEDRIEGCLTRSMNGKPIPLNSPEMTAIVSYLKFLSDGRRVGEPTAGRGAGKMAELTRPADPTHGKVIYLQNCAACHGAEGLGRRAGAAGDAQGYTIPPLWGPDSYNDGAGMGQLINIANFVHSNMPNGTTWTHPALSEADAWDVAAFVDSQPRPHKSGLDKDFPNRLEKKVDVPYGPYADSFSSEQHKYGPFEPIRTAIKALKAKNQSENKTHSLSTKG